MNKFEVKLSQEKIEFINDVYQKKIYYWKKAALESVLTKNERKQLTDLAPLRVVLARKAAIKNVKSVYKIIFY